MNNNELLELIKNEYERINPKNCWDFFEKRDRRIPCLPTLKKIFGTTYNGILLLAGVSESNVKFIRGETRGKEYYLNGLREVAQKLGKTPTIEEYENHGYSVYVLKKYYKTYTNALSLIGLEPNYEHISKYMSKDDIINIYRKISDGVGFPATTKILRDNLNFSVKIFMRAFTSINTLRKEAGLEQNNYGRLIYTKEEIMILLIDAYNKNGGKLTNKEIKSNPMLPSYDTILNHFKLTSIDEVWREVELSILLEKKTA